MIDANGTARCVFLAHSNAVLQGFTLTRGLAPVNQGGGGVYLFQGGTVRNCAIIGNTADFGGGLICQAGGVVQTCMIAQNHGNSSVGGGGFLLYNGGLIYNSTVVSNSSPYGAGGLCDTGGVVTNCTVTQNSASVAGGGVYMASGGILAASIIVSNSARYAGGGIDINPNGGYVTDCEVSYNQVQASGQGGGGISILRAGLVRRSLIKGNQAALANGGGIYCYSGGTIENCQILDNIGGGGGGLNCVGDMDTYNDPRPVVRDTLIARNTALAGGGIQCYVSNVFENCTIVSNTATITGGGIQCGGYNKFQNIIIYNNLPDNNTNSGSSSYSYCCTTPLILGAGNTAADPVFDDSVGGDYHLRAFSPCIDAGTNDSWAVNTTDLDGNPRIFNQRVDMGCYESSISARNLRVTPQGVAVDWSAIAGATCQMQSCTNLFQGSWNNVANITVFTNRSGTILDTTPPSRSAYYRLLWLR